MILKRIYEEYNFNIELILIKEYKRLKISQDELNVLLVLFSIHKKRRTFSLNAISRRMDFTQNEIAPIIESLLDKELLNIKIESNNNKEREVFDLDGVFNKINELFIADEKLKNQQESENNVSETVMLIESYMNRLLRPQELERIRSWYENNTYIHEDIIKTINNSNDHPSISNIEKLLSQDMFEEIEIDEKTNRILESIYKKV